MKIMKSAVFSAFEMARRNPNDWPFRSSYRSAITTAPSLIYPIHVLPAIVFSGAALVFQNDYLLTKALLEIYLLKMTSIEGVFS